MEEWIAENESGPTLDNFNYLLEMLKSTSERFMGMQREQGSYRGLVEAFLTEKELGDDWNTFIQEKENAVQKQQTEEVSVQEEAESSEEVVEASEEEKE